MRRKSFQERFQATTRGRIVNLLRRAEMTAGEMSARLGLTSNAVRAHLATLERDGLVQPTGRRPGVRKPHVVYGLTTDAESLFPKAYGEILHNLLDVLAQQLTPGKIEAALREVGRRVASSRGVGAVGGAGEMSEHLAAALEVARDLGGVVEAEQTDGRIVIRGYSCPLAAALPGHPEACALLEALLSEVLGAKMRQVCDRSDPPRCRFEVEGSLSGQSVARR